MCWSLYIYLFRKGIVCHDHNWKNSNWSKLLQKKWKLRFVLYNKKKIIVHTKSWTWKGCVEVIKFSVSLFVHILDEWKREQLEFILLRGRDHFLIALAYCRLAFLFDSLLSSSLSTTSVPSQSFRSLAAWYQVWFFCSKSILFKI